MIALSCPSCGANLQLPDQLDIAHCLYCGGKIILRSENVLNEIVNTKRFSELAQIALEAKNYQEAVNYSNKILEIETQNIDAWLIKAEATLLLSTSTTDNYEIALEYVARASKINSSDTRIAAAKTKLAKLYSAWLNNLGVEALKSARQTYQHYANRATKTATEKVNNGYTAMRESNHDYMRAMDLFIKASNQNPYNITALENIKVCCSESKAWIPKTPLVDQKIKKLGSLKAKYEAEHQVAYLQKSLDETKAKLLQLEGKEGFFQKLSKANLVSTVNALEKDLRRKQDLAAYEPS